MAEGELSFWSYVREAFGRRARVPLLGHLPVNWMVVAAFAVLGLANPGFWLLGGAVETLYLTLRSSSARFQKLIQGERLLAAQQSWEEKVQTVVQQLSAESRLRYRQLLRQCRLILGISHSLDDESLGDFRDLRSRSLNQLLGIFLRLLRSREVMIENVQHLDRSALEAEIRRVEGELAGVDRESSAALARSLEATLAIQRKRLENLARAGESLKVIDAELARIEQQVELIREESAVTGRPELLSVRLDAVTSAMSETNRFLDEHADIFTTLGGEEAAAAVSELPRLPALEEEG